MTSMECYGQQICFQSAVDKYSRLPIPSSFFFKFAAVGIIFYTGLFTMCFMQENDHLPGVNVRLNCAKNVLLGFNE